MTGVEPPCQLCGLPLPVPPVRLPRAGEELLFCCDSCRQIFQMLHGDEPGDAAPVPQPGEKDHE